MPYSLLCPNCGARFGNPLRTPGDVVNCLYCGASVTVPASEDESPAEPVMPEVPASTPESQSETPPPGSPPRAEASQPGPPPANEQPGPPSGPPPEYGMPAPPLPANYYRYGPPQTSGLAVASLITGILSLPFSFCCCAFVPVAILAIGLGIGALNQIKKSNGRMTGAPLAWAGIVTGIVAIVLSIGIILVQILIGAFDPEMMWEFENFSNELE